MALWGGGDVTIINCYNTGEVSATAAVTSYEAYAHAGGIVGDGGVTIANCYNSGDVSASTNGSFAYAGGIAGSGIGTITNCYNTGKVSADVVAIAYAGGIVGYNGYDATTTNCYNIGEVSANAYGTYPVAAHAYAGGIAGSSIGTITNCYYINNINEGFGYGTSICVKCTAEQMKKRETFVGFDFDQIWTMVGDPNYLYPELRHTHSYNTTWDNDSYQHWRECSVCSAKKDEATHTYDNACDTTCNTCGYTRQVQTTPPATTKPETTKPSTTTPQTTNPPATSTTKDEQTTPDSTTAPNTTEPDVTVPDTNDGGNGKGSGKKDNTTNVVIIVVASALVLGGGGTALALILKKKK